MEAEQTRIAVMSIIVEDRESAESLNRLLHNYGNYIIGRMGLPYEKKKLSLMSVALDAPENIISELAGKVGNLPNISVKTAYAKR
ncbi:MULTISPECIES: TM1266 family iron-only hydrogenase system putative regulator [Stomatobaculum]|jgi:putative iron-only hydrogenase system regulator|uniref:TM1266 family iron-only hydrogenase system putative regulator n=1 Tax=Stomatobaculum TaxID=1213720 RepID=UPI00272BD223|nr:MULTISPECIES: TM1266 family iron-only hydrogenase system putative regulator [Stomatobaculum]WLD85979.1 iron-only hydrogenase system regulator [Stomatobaculum sp. F0698]